MSVHKKTKVSKATLIGYTSIDMLVTNPITHFYSKDLYGKLKIEIVCKEAKYSFFLKIDIVCKDACDLWSQI